ncbi:MAG: hypothetical protein PXX77_11305 [Gallionella sp.]|nr:hypothetical protein [Gallionella sp.]
MFTQLNKIHPMQPTSAANLYLAFLQSRVLITPVEAGAACGWAKQTVYNKLCDNKFPIPTVEFAGRTMVRTVDLLEYIDKLRTSSSTMSDKFCRIGRPTKAESIRRKTEKSGVAK